MLKITRLLPENIANRIITKEFQTEDTLITSLRTFLEILTDSYVVTYKRDTFLKCIPMSSYLCAMLKAQT